MLNDCQSFAINANWGTYNGQNAVGISGVSRLDDNFFFNAGVGIGATQGNVGGRAGLTFAF